MKATSLFRTLTPLVVIPDDEALTPVAEAWLLSETGLGPQFGEYGEYICRDPEGGQTETIGLSAITDDGKEYFRDIDGSGVLFFVQIAKRNLPARVIRDDAEKKRKAIEDETGRKVGSKEFRALIEDSAFELLPKAFITRTRVAVILTSDNRLFLFTAKGKHIDAITSFMVQFFAEGDVRYTLSPPDVRFSVEHWMTMIANPENATQDEITATDFAVMRNEDEEATAQVRVVNRNLDFDAVRDTLRAGYRVRQIGLYHSPLAIDFRLSIDLTLRQITFSDDAVLDMKNNSDGDPVGDLHAVAWIVITTYRTLLDDLVRTINGSAGETEDDDL
jgi:DNA recombination-dependent growth factor C